MKFILYTHSLISDWNHGNAHFLRGVLTELHARGHSTLAMEPADGWSFAHLEVEQGPGAIARFARDFPQLQVARYGSDFDHEALIADADLVIVHEWTDPALIAQIGSMRRRGNFTLLFHDTHHRGASDAGAISDLPLDDYDAVLAFGEALRERYLASGWGRQVYTWHEAADISRFRPLASSTVQGDLIWIGNWGDGERTAELMEYLIEPVRSQQLSGKVHGVRYPTSALKELKAAGLQFAGWIANADVPAAFASHRMTVHVPRQPYVRSLPGIPTIRVFEALACGIPLVCAPWEDTEGLFRPGQDYLVARNGIEMGCHLAAIRSDPAMAGTLAAAGLSAIRSRHTCAHRVDQLLSILSQCGTDRVRKALTAEIAA